MRVDVHVHVGQICRPCQPEGRFSFEPAGAYAPYDAYMSDPVTHGLGMRVAQRLFGLPRGLSGPERDAAIEKLLLDHVLGARLIDRAVILAFDQYHTSAGEPVGARGRGRRFGTDLYVSNTYVRQLWRRHPERILFGASIHPYRTGPGGSATAMLEEVAAAGAVLVKWLPIAQNIDAEDPRSVAFLRRAGEIGMPMLIHYGGERALGRQHPEFMDPSGLLGTLVKLREEGTMPRVIVAHAATPTAWPIGSARHFRTLTTALLGPFADAPLYTDLAALALCNRAHWLVRLARMVRIHPKLVHGSDFPVPPTVIAFRRRLGRDYGRIKGLPSSLDRDVAIKSALGFGEEVLARGSVVLAERIAVADGIARVQGRGRPD